MKFNIYKFLAAIFIINLELLQYYNKITREDWIRPAGHTLHMPVQNISVVTASKW